MEVRSAADGEFRRRVEAARRVWEWAGEAFTEPVPAERVDRSWSRLDRATAPGGVSGRSFLPPSSRLAWRGRMLVALLSVLVVAAGLWRFLPALEPASRAAAPPREYAAAPGHRLPIRLADGSQVTLGSGSRLRVPTRFAEGDRSVYLEGRAYFQVAHDPRRPFRVHAGGVVTRVLGTQFDVSAYPDDAGVRVAVRTGRVGVRWEGGAGEGEVLQPGDRATVDRGGRMQVEHGVDLRSQFAWTRGGLRFRRSTLGSAVVELRHSYGLRVEIADPTLADRRFTAEFENESADSVLQMIGDLVDARVSREGSRVVFSGR